MVYLNFFTCWLMEGSGSVQIITDLDPRGPKIYGSYGSGIPHVVQQSVPVVWLLLESEWAAVVEVRGKLAWRSLAQDIDGRGHFLLRDPLILLLLGGGPQSLPRQGALKQIFRLDFFGFIFHFPSGSTKDLIFKRSKFSVRKDPKLLAGSKPIRNRN